MCDAASSAGGGGGEGGRRGAIDSFSVISLGSFSVVLSSGLSIDSLSWLIRAVGSSMSISGFVSVLVLSSNETFLDLELSRDRESCVVGSPVVREGSDLEYDLDDPRADFSVESFLDRDGLSLEGFLLSDDLSIESLRFRDDPSIESYLPPRRESALSFLLSRDLSLAFICSPSRSPVSSL